jgi:hypothetical protein
MGMGRDFESSDAIDIWILTVDSAGFYESPSRAVNFRVQKNRARYFR